MTKVLQKRDSRLFFRFLSNTVLYKKINLIELKKILIKLGYIKDGIDPDHYIEIKKLWPRETVIEQIQTELK